MQLFLNKWVTYNPELGGDNLFQCVWRWGDRTPSQCQTPSDKLPSVVILSCYKQLMSATAAFPHFLNSPSPRSSSSLLAPCACLQPLKWDVTGLEKQRLSDLRRWSLTFPGSKLCGSKDNSPSVILLGEKKAGVDHTDVRQSSGFSYRYLRGLSGISIST